jgi:S-adenosylmethionine hydrolase
MHRLHQYLLIAVALASTPVLARAPLVLITDFGTQDGAVSAMKGVAYSVSQDLLISDLSHENPDILTGAYRLYQAEEFWPKGTVFVAVIDPGVGTERLSVVLKTRTGRYFVAPNNGLLTLVAERDGIEELRQRRSIVVPDRNSHILSTVATYSAIPARGSRRG